jgi:hypothetical protein
VGREGDWKAEKTDQIGNVHFGGCEGDVMGAG